MIKIPNPTLRIQRFNREWLLGLSIITLLFITLLCAVVISLLTVNVSTITATEDFHYYVTAENQVFDLVPGDVLRIERTPAKNWSGQNIEILKVYTTKGFVYAVPDDDYYEGAKKLAGSADFNSLMIWNKDNKEDVILDMVHKTGYAIGTPVSNRIVLFALRGLQNITLLGAGFGLLLLIFPLRLDKSSEAAPVVGRVEQPA